MFPYCICMLCTDKQDESLKMCVEKSNAKFNQVFIKLPINFHFDTIRAWWHVNVIAIGVFWCWSWTLYTVNQFRSLKMRCKMPFSFYFNLLLKCPYKQAKCKFKSHYCIIFKLLLNYPAYMLKILLLLLISIFIFKFTSSFE